MEVVFEAAVDELDFLDVFEDRREFPFEFLLPLLLPRLPWESAVVVVALLSMLPWLRWLWACELLLFDVELSCRPLLPAVNVTTSTEEADGQEEEEEPSSERRELDAFSPEEVALLKEGRCEVESKGNV